MATEVTPKIRSGFFLDPINATRIKDSLNEQVKKANNGADAHFEYEVKHANGAVSQPASLDEILSGENDGSRRVIRLAISASAAVPSNGTAGVKFSDISDDSNSDEVPVSYFVKSDDQDWAFVTASTIDERIEKAKTGWLMNVFLVNAATLSLMLVVLLVVFLITTVFINSPVFPIIDSSWMRSKQQIPAQ
jgi:hypothetical protein